jgi:hypothetical protein
LVDVPVELLLVFLLGEPLAKFYTTATLWETLALIGPSVFEPSFASAADVPEKTVPQGQDPPGADNGQSQSPPTQDKEVIPPPPIGDEPLAAVKSLPL